MPPCLRVIEPSAWRKRSKITGSISGAMPSPWSTKRISTSSPAQRIVTSIALSLGENLIALTSRFVNTCCSRDGSPHTMTLSGGNARLIVTRRALACGSTASIADSRIIDGNVLSRSMRSWPVMIRDTSSRSLISWFCSRALRSIVSSACAS